MKISCHLLLFITAVFHYSSSAQTSSPHLVGKVDLSMKDGLIKCDFRLSKLPKLGKHYKILLYRGFNIGLLRNDTGKVLDYSGFYDSKLQGEAAAYLPLVNDDTLSLPAGLTISYTGAFPIYTDTLNSFDYKGFIAFNGKTVRTTEQSKWYPVIYDIINDREILDFTYDISVNCEDCKTIYINGSEARPGPMANFRSGKPNRLLLFAGNYEMQSLSNSTFLNANLTQDEADVFNSNISFITNYYTQYLTLPYQEKVTFLQHQAVEPFGPKRSWGFVTFPTIAVAGVGFKSQVNVKTGHFRDTSSYRFYAHELGHYYFGQLLQPNAALRWFFLESMAEFLSVKATEAKYGKMATRQYIAERKQRMTDRKVTPLSTVASPDSIGQFYRYQYGPLVLLAMEKQFGEEKIRKFCIQAINNAGQNTDYIFLQKLINLAGINDDEWTLFEKKVINQTECRHIFDYL